jgi:integrin beta 3
MNEVNVELDSLRAMVPKESDIQTIVLASMPKTPELDVDSLIKRIEVPELPDISAMVKESVDLAVAAIEVKDGEPGKDGIDGKDGTSVTIDDVRPIIAKEVEVATAKLEEAVKNIPQGADGERGQEGPPGKDGLNGKDGADGIGLASAMIDRAGELVVTLSNGIQKNLGPIIGKDGEPGLAGKDGSHGLNGKDGVDGIGFDDMSAEVRDGILYLMWSKGDVIKEAAVPGLRHRGLFKEGSEYRMGDNVTWDGCTWCAVKDAPQGKPIESRDWLLAAKKGRNAGSPIKLEKNR